MLQKLLCWFGFHDKVCINFLQYSSNYDIEKIEVCISCKRIWDRNKDRDKEEQLLKMKIKQAQRIYEESNAKSSS